MLRNVLKSAWLDCQALWPENMVDLVKKNGTDGVCGIARGVIATYFDVECLNTSSIEYLLKYMRR